MTDFEKIEQIKELLKKNGEDLENFSQMSQEDYINEVSNSMSLNDIVQNFIAWRNFIIQLMEILRG